MQLRPGALQAITEDARNSFITCHDTLPSVTEGRNDPVICRGWWDGFGAGSATIQTLIKFYGEPIEVDPPAKEGGTGADEA